MSSLLLDIFNLGEDMHLALENDDVDRYFAFLEQRGTLLDELRRYDHPSEIDEDWREMADALRAQHEVLMETVARQEAGIQHALAKLEQLKDARRSYHAPSPRGTILNENLRV